MLRCFPIALSLITAGFLLPAGLTAQQQRTGNAVQTPPTSSGTVRIEIPRAPSAPARATSTTPSAGASSTFLQHPVTHNPSLQGSKSVRIDRAPSQGSSQQPNHGQHGGGSDASRGQGGGGQGRYPYVYGSYPVGVPYALGPSFGYTDIGADEDVDDRQAGPQQGAGQAMIEAAPPPPNDPEMATNDTPAFRPEYRSQHDEGMVVSVRAQPTTTLIFKDGRPSVQVHNYALTGSTLYALDGDTRQEIPLASLNVAATIEANRAAGVDFAVPVSR